MTTCYAQTVRRTDREQLLHAALDLLATTWQRRGPDGSSTAAWWQAA